MSPAGALCVKCATPTKDNRDHKKQDPYLSAMLCKQHFKYIPSLQLQLKVNRHTITTEMFMPRS